MPCENDFCCDTCEKEYENDLEYENDNDEDDE